MQTLILKQLKKLVVVHPHWTGVLSRILYTGVIQSLSMFEMFTWVVVEPQQSLMRHCSFESGLLG